MADDPVKFFTWRDLERILISVSREPPETAREFLAWLRAIHVFSLSLKSVFRTSSNLLKIDPRSPLGETAYGTFYLVRDAVSSAIDLFPQEEAQALLEILEETIVPIKLEP